VYLDRCFYRLEGALYYHFSSPFPSKKVRLEVVEKAIVLVGPPRCAFPSNTTTTDSMQAQPMRCPLDWRPVLEIDDLSMLLLLRLVKEEVGMNA